MTTTSQRFMTQAPDNRKEKTSWRQHFIFIYVVCLLLIGQKSFAVDLTVLFTFAQDETKGYDPSSALFRANDGTFYGTCDAGGVPQPGLIREGMVFHLTT